MNAGAGVICLCCYSLVCVALRSRRDGLGGGGGGRFGVYRLLASAVVGPFLATCSRPSAPNCPPLLGRRHLVARGDDGPPALSAVAARREAAASFWNL